MKYFFFFLLPLMAAAGALHAQVSDTTAANQTDSLQLSSKARKLKGVTISAKKPLYSVDGEKQLYNTAEDPSVQTGTASDALQNAPGVEVDAEGNITLRGSQSVEVWINDRPSNLSGESLRQYIKTLPANAIERIEVITNPSARYGSGGPVVNIITTAKVSRNEFFSFGTNANLRPQVSPWLSYVYANDRFSINAYAEYDYSHTWGDQSGSMAMLTPSGDTSNTKTYTAHSDYRRHGSYFYVGGHYNIDTTRTLAFWGAAYPSTYRLEGYSDMDWKELIYSPGDYSHRRTVTGNIPQGGYYGGLDYRHRYDSNGKQLWIRAYANGFGYKSEGTQSRIYSNQHHLDYTVRDITRKKILANSSIDAGYTLPFADHWELEVGAGAAYDPPTSYSYTRDSLPSHNIDTLQSYEQTSVMFKYQAYATLLRRFGDLTVKAGLQLGEEMINTTYDGYTHVDTKGRWMKFVPSLHVTYRTPSLHNFTFSYTHRSSEPENDQITDFVFYDDDSFSLGNSDLRPSHVHTFEGGWNRYFENFGSIGIDAYYQAYTDEIADLNDVRYEPIYAKEVNFRKPINIGNSSVGGFTANVTYRPTAMFNVRLNASLYNRSFYAQFREGEWYDESMWTASARLNVWAKVWKRLQLFGNINYSTRALSLMQYSGPLFTADAGLSADFFERRLSLYLNIRDIFASNVQEWENTNPYFNTQGSSSSSSRYVSVGLTLRFGKMDLESQARTHNEDQQ